MASPREFMERVVAWPGEDGAGFVNLHWTSPKGPGMRGRPYKTIQEFMDMAKWLTTKPSIAKDIYFCLSTQSQMGRIYQGKATALRLSANAAFLKAIWLDVDVKPEKGYSTIVEALDAIKKFINSAFLPPVSAITFSGGGIHVYWISKDVLSRTDWSRYAEGLKAEVLKFGLKCDAGLTTDCARVLRVPGTFNFKTTPPRTVRLAGLGQSYDFGTDLSHLAAIKPAVTVAVNSKTVLPFDLKNFTKPAAAFRELDPKDSLAEGINVYSDTPLDPAEVFKGCPHFFEAAKTHGTGFPQGLWMLDILGTTFFEDGTRWAHYLSKGHSGYTKGDTDAMFTRKVRERKERGLGWPSCHAIESNGCKLCATCVFKGKIKSPLNLALHPVPPTPAVHPAPAPPPELDLPTGFTVDPDSGWICQVVQKKVAQGMTYDEMLPLFMCKLSDPWAQGGSKRALHFTTSLDMNNTGPVTVTDEDLATEQQLMKVLRKAGVKPYAPNKNRVEHFMTSWMEKLDAAQHRINTVPFGWMFNGSERVGFVYGGRAVLKNGTTLPAGFADEKLEKFYRPTGSPDVWHEALKIVTSQKAPELEAIVATSFAAPLMFVPAQYNGMFCAWSNGSGAHKTTSIAIGAAVWGNPQLTKENTKSSVKGLMHKLGELRNLPIYWDEIGDSRKMDAVREFLTICTEGTGGTLLHQDRSFREKEEWQTMVTIGANLSLWDEITKNVKNTDAQLQRVFEFHIEKRPDTHNSSDVQRLIDRLNRNYGHMGLAYSDFIGRNPEAIDKFVKQVLNDFEDDVKARSEERFRMAMAACTFAGAALANQIGASFNLDILYPFLKKEFLSQRDRINMSTTIGGSRMNTNDALSQFIKDNVENILWTQNMPLIKRGKPAPVVFLAGPNQQRPRPIHIHCVVDQRVIRISKTQFSDYLARIKHSSNAVFEGLVKYQGAKLDGPRVNLAAGTGLAGAREQVIEISVPPGSQYEDLLFTHTPVDQRSSLVASVMNALPTETENNTLQKALPTKDMGAALAQATADLELVRNHGENQ